MQTKASTIDTGLRGVPVASTRISYVDGEQGKLLYRGYRIQDLAEGASYEEVVHLLLQDKLPDSGELADMRDAMAQEREMPEHVLQALRVLSGRSRPMDVLQGMVPLLAHGDADLGNTSKEASRRIGVRLVSRLPVLIASWHRWRQGLDPVIPDPQLGQAANFLYMLSGHSPDPQAAQYLDTCLVLHAEHSLNASTFAAREICSTRAHMYSAVSAAVGSLSGELHGGANARVMQMLEEIGSKDRVKQYVQSTLDKGGKIMGMGHAVYRTMDPRAWILASISRRLGERSSNPKWYELSVELERQAREYFRHKKGRDIYPNVDFYSATVYSYLGIPVDLFTPLFAAARVAGWAAHVIEERHAEAAETALYRPSSEYVGDYCGSQECAFVPLENR
ncbi:MAG: citrate/2-methylcitrate synthase [Desulfohalobiaceae bacterium]